MIYTSLSSYIQRIKNRKGFAMLFTVLIMSLILTIAIGISNLTFKQTLLSSLAKDSQIAFYQADKGLECGMYYDVTQNVFPIGTTAPPGTIYCGDNMLEYDDSASGVDFFVYREVVSNNTGPCVAVTFDKTDGIKYVVRGRGYNVCGDSPRKVERLLQVTY